MSSESESELLVRERIRDLEATAAKLRETEQRLAAEVNALQRLQQVATQLTSTDGTEALFERVLDAAVAIVHSDFASIGKFDPKPAESGGELRLLVHRGFSPEGAKRWKWMSPSGRTVCGEALRTGQRVAIADVRHSDFMAGSEDLEQCRDSEIYALQTTPLVSRSGALLGMLSTHWREPHELSATELRTLDILARLAADLIERSAVKEEIREHNQRLRALFSHQLVAINITSPEKNWVDVNETWCKMIGYSREELAQTDWASLTHPEDLAADVKQFDRLAAGEIDQYRLEKRFIRKDGSILEVEISVSCVRNPDGSLRQVIGLGTDIGERRHTEEHLRDTERRFRSLYDNAFDAIFLARTDGSVEAANSMACDMLGMTEEEIRNAGRNGFMVNDKLLREALETRRLTGKVRAELTFIRKDGSRREGEVASIALDKSGETFVIMRDITERKQAEAALSESERHLKNAERIAQMGHFQWDLQSNRVSGSDEMYRIFGKAPDYRPTFNGFLVDLQPRDRERMEELIKDSLARKVGHTIEYQITRDNDDPRTIFCIWEVLTGKEGTPLRIFGTCQDVTESRRSQEESFSRQKLESVGTLARGIAHDFNNLLGGILAQAELALGELAEGSSPQKEIKAIRDVAIRGSEIVRELMIYAGKGGALSEAVDLSETVKDMLELLKVSISKHATLEIDFGENLPPVCANAAQIQQIVMNLVTNASEAVGERDGVIRVTTSCVKVDRNSPTATSDRLLDGAYLQLEVSDTGCGMSPETRTRVFDPFFTTKSAGHGLGLAVVAGIVRSLGGRIHFTSELGKGSTFYILLPSGKADAVGTSLRAPGADLLADRRHAGVLVVEDENVLRQAVVKMLRKAGFDVFEAGNGSSAIDLLRAKIGAVDVILLDITIPGASSREVVSEAAKLSASTRVVLTSAYSQDLITSEIDRTTVVSFIRKPYKIADLVQTIRNALSI